MNLVSVFSFSISFVVTQFPVFDFFLVNILREFSISWIQPELIQLQNIFDKATNLSSIVGFQKKMMERLDSDYRYSLMP